jgi:hypothetical protein
MMSAMQRTMGNTRLSRLWGTTVQAKLTVGAPNDPYEQEADRVATHVVSQKASSGPAAENPSAANSGIIRLQQATRSETIQRSPLSDQLDLMWRSTQKKGRYF